VLGAVELFNITTLGYQVAQLRRLMADPKERVTGPREPYEFIILVRQLSVKCPVIEGEERKTSCNCTGLGVHDLEWAFTSHQA
jgi:hypothetical protein